MAFLSEHTSHFQLARLLFVWVHNRHRYPHRGASFQFFCIIPSRPWQRWNHGDDDGQCRQAFQGNARKWLSSVSKFGHQGGVSMWLLFSKCTLKSQETFSYRAPQLRNTWNNPGAVLWILPEAQTICHWVGCSPSSENTFHSAISRNRINNQVFDYETLRNLFESIDIV